MVNTFSTSAFRSFKKFVGELTSVAAGIYVGVQEALPAIDALDTPDPWESVAKKHGIILCGLRSERVLSSAIRLNLVSLYSGFDLFVSDIRSQFHQLHGKEWEQNKDDTPFQALAKNSPSIKQKHENRLGLDRIATLNYYRLVRNSIAHPKDEAMAAARRFYSDNGGLLSMTTAAYGMKSVPSQVDVLSFHDIKLLARVAIDLAAAVDKDFDPGDERLAKMLPANALKLPKSAQRNYNAVKGYLSVNYGIQAERAERIISIYETHQLGG